MDLRGPFGGGEFLGLETQKPNTVDFPPPPKKKQQLRISQGGIMSLKIFGCLVFGVFFKKHLSKNHWFGMHATFRTNYSIVYGMVFRIRVGQ